MNINTHSVGSFFSNEKQWKEIKKHITKDRKGKGKEKEKIIKSKKVYVKVSQGILEEIRGGKSTSYGFRESETCSLPEKKKGKKKRSKKRL